MDDGPEMASKAMIFWSKRPGAKLHFIRPGKPTQNVFVDSFNGRFRGGCLNWGKVAPRNHASALRNQSSSHGEHIIKNRVYVAVRACCGIGPWIYHLFISGNFDRSVVHSAIQGQSTTP